MIVLFSIVLSACAPTPGGGGGTPSNGEPPVTGVGTSGGDGSSGGGTSGGGGSGTPSQCKHENVVTLDVKNATCTETGLTEGKKCSDCEVIIVAQTTIDMKPHTWGMWTQTTAPTEDDDGQEKATCADCNTEETRPIPALSHTHKYNNDTWAYDGTYHWHPTTCNHDNVAGVLTKTEHSWDTGTETKAPTCVEKGEKTYTCTCGKTKTEDIAASGHTEETVSAAVEATCTQTGKTASKKCSVCGVVTMAQTTVAKKPHTKVTIPAVPATITATGLTAGEKCSVCNQILVAQKETSQLTATAEQAIAAINSLPSGGSITIVLDSSVTNIPYELQNALKSANKKVTLDLSKSGITSIRTQAFSCCKSLVSVKLHSSTTVINERAFYECTSLTSIKIPSSIQTIVMSVFDGCTSLSQIDYAGTREDWNKKISPYDTSTAWKDSVPAEGVTCSDGYTYRFTTGNSLSYAWE